MFCKKEKRNYPQWFIDELVDERDKNKAINHELKTRDRVCVKCTTCGYIYITQVSNRIKLSTGEPYHGCKECARKKHSEVRKKYIQENYDKVVETNRKNIESQKRYYKDNPEKLIERGKKHSKWCSEHPECIQSLQNWRANNPDKVVALNEKHKQWYKENPDKVVEIGESISSWYKNNPDKVKEKAQNYSILCKTTGLGKQLSDIQKKRYKENPDLVKQIGKKLSLWYSSHHKEVKQKAENHRLFLKEHPEIKKKISIKIKEWYKNSEWKKGKYYKIREKATQKRIDCLSDSFLFSLKEILYPEDYNNLVISGTVNSLSKVRVKCPECGNYDIHSLYNICSITKNTIDSLCYCKDCLGKLNSSKQEKEIREFISSFDSSIPIENNRDIIPPYELDLFYPEKNIAIEYNGAYWHSEDKRKLKNLHYQKFYLCRQKGIRLISIFSQDWEYKKEKVQNILKNAFLPSNSIYARNCTVRELEKEERKTFLDTYHFDGDSKQSLFSYGLFYKDILVSVMSFGLLRGNNPKRNNQGYYELLRFANKANIRVLGGASKLFNFFVKKHNPIYVLSYSDNDFFSGDIYNKLNFSFVSFGEHSLDYQWVKYKSVLSRYSCTVDILLKKYPKYKDMEIKGSIEDYIMRDLGYLKIYRCGNSKWVWWNK